MLKFNQKNVIALQLKQKVLMINAMLVVCGAGILYRYADKFERLYSRIELLSTSSGGESASARVAMISSSIEAILSFPTVLLGLGIGGFSFHYAGLDDIRGVYPHNILLEITVELGFFALIAIVAWLFYSLKEVFRMSENECCSKITFFALLVFAFLNAMISGDFNDNRLLFFSIGTIIGVKRLDIA